MEGDTTISPYSSTERWLGYQFEKTERDLMRVIFQTVQDQVQPKSLNIQGANGVSVGKCGWCAEKCNANAIGGDSLLDVSIATRNGRQFKINTKGTFAPVQTTIYFRSIFAASPMLAKKFVRQRLQNTRVLGFRDGIPVDGNVPPIVQNLQGENNSKNRSRNTADGWTC